MINDVKIQIERKEKIIKDEKIESLSNPEIACATHKFVGCTANCTQMMFLARLMTRIMMT